jgi:hypothetical protein
MKLRLPSKMPSRCVAIHSYIYIVLEPQQVIDKNNKRLKGTNPVLTDRRYQFERVRTLWSAKKGVFCSVDFEAWEYDHKLITEFGWSYVGWKDGVKTEEKGHFINDAAKNYWNRKYVQDYRDVRLIRSLQSTTTYSFSLSTILARARR